ncbi:mitochondrial ribosomal protein S25 [Cokeromyces recurvatus]|uniref:mitochondrial ribosomal protein S25 n=1 Tax=Cokeromyces recurvatus TaxID=90255 RepID=UPI00221E78EA|nr:mitochondrial ribosomal protein S25 [Cokeromyces recurvatus]KAI7901487.1 mitochondrial ribosomal protein S25 [Cokeromyces recurvatus]
MAFRAPPIQLAKHVSNLMKGKLITKTPVWLPVVQAFPPGPSIVRSQNSEVNVSGQTEMEQTMFAKPQPTQSLRHSQKHLRTRPPRPRAIVYPEDKLRKQFYKDHPFELARPKVLVEPELGINRTDFSKLMLDGMHPSQIDGEAVIKYQLYLMVHEKMPERKAYAKATSEFYEIRAKQEEEEREARAKMSDILQVIQSKKWTKKGIYLEGVALRKGFEDQF